MTALTTQNSLMTAQKEIATHLISNIIDSCDEAFIAQLMPDGKLNIDALIHHSVTRLVTVYSELWNAVYGTWPTKKDCSDFVTIIGVKANLDDNLLQHIFDHEPFFALRLYSERQEVVNNAKAAFIRCISKLRNQDEAYKYISSVLLKKWLYRFSSSVDKETVATLGNEHILRAFLKLFLHKTTVYNEEDALSVSGFKPHGISFKSCDFKFMSLEEREQYTLYRDNRFLLELATFAVVTLDEGVGSSPPLGLKEVVNKTLKNHAMILCLNTELSDKNDKFTYMLHRGLYKRLPRIATHLVCVVSSKDGDADADAARELLSLCPQSSKIIVYYVNGGAPPSSAFAPVALTLTDEPSLVKPGNSVYFMPSNIPSKDPLLGKEMQQVLWKHYLKGECPFKHGHTYNAVMYVNFLAMYLNTHHDEMSKLKDIIASQKKDSSQAHALVIIDNRYNYLTVIASLISLYNIVKHDENIKDAAWKLYVYTSSDAAKRYQNIFEDTLGSDEAIFTVNVLAELNCDLFHLENYNAICKSIEFWEGLRAAGHKKCIIIQDDGILINGANLKTYLEYDYVGAPWVDAVDNAFIKEHINRDLVGNGGFSVRDVDKALEVVTRFDAEKHELFFHNINEIPEDVYFVKHLVAMGAKVAPFDVARQFSVEQVPYQNPVGFHKFWAYHQPSTVNGLFENFLRNNKSR